MFEEVRSSFHRFHSPQKPDEPGSVVVNIIEVVSTPVPFQSIA